MITAYLLDHYETTQDGTIAPACVAAIDWRPGESGSDEPTMHDIAQLIPDPNAVVMRIQVHDLALILSHPDYGAGALLYDVPNPYPGDKTPDAAEYGLRRAHMAKLGINPARVTALLGSAANRKSRKAAAESIITWTKTLTRAANGSS